MLVETTKIPPPKSAKDETSITPGTVETPAADETVEESLPATPPRRLLPLLIGASAVLALLTAYYVWSPYHSVASLKTAMNNGDPAELEAAIDFPSVRDSLKAQIQDQLQQLQATRRDPSVAPAMLTVLSMLDQSVDNYVTPDGISGLIQKSNPSSSSGPTQAITPDEAGMILQALTSQPVNNEGLAGLDDFVLDRDAAQFHLQFQGLGWKLKSVDLRPDLWQPTPSDSAGLLLTPVVDTFLNHGDAQYKKGDWHGAIADFSQVLAIDPQSAAAYNERGAARAAKGDLDGAIKDYTQAVTINPELAAAFEGRGNAKTARNDLDGAIADYTQAIRLDPSLAIALDSRGNAKTAKDDLDGAIADFTQAISIDPNLASAYSDRGFARQANGNLDGAINDYTQALALKPKTASAYYNRGLARLSQGSLDAAIVDFDHALAFDPKIAEAYYYRGNAKNANHDLDGAIADYTQALSLNSKTGIASLAYCNRGLVHQAKGELDDAVADYTQALALDPKMAIAYYNRGFIKAQKNDLDGAIADSTQALYLDPKISQAYYNRGFAKLIKGNLDGAFADLKEFCDSSPKETDADNARVYLWLIDKAQNAKTDADQELSTALQETWNSAPEDPVSKTASFLLGSISEDDYLGSAVSTDPKTLQGLQCQTWYFAGMKRLLGGDKTAAIDHFRKCVATGQINRSEYALAQAELQILAPVPPVAAPANATVSAPASSVSAPPASP